MMDNEKTYLAEWCEGRIKDSDLKQSYPNEDLALLQRILDTTSSASVSTPDALDWDQFQLKLKEKSKGLDRYSRIPILSIAASIVGVLLAVTLYLNTVIQIESQNKITDLVLPDQSTVTLLPDSKISYKRSFGIFNRAIELEGEGIFKVTKGTAFSVNTQKGRVDVLGTIFKVISSRNAPFSVSCLEGKVRVDDEFILHGNEHFDELSGGVQNMAVTQAFVQKSGIHYYKTPIRYLIPLFEKTHQISIQLNSKNNYNFSGIFPLNDLEKGLEALSLPFKLNVTRLDSTTYSIDE